MLAYHQDHSETTTPSSKTSLKNGTPPCDHSSITKKLRLDNINVVKIKQEKVTKADEIKVKVEKMKPGKVDDQKLNLKMI